MSIEKDLRVATLLDYYSPMLTKKQRDVIDLYYNEDLSLGEIAEHENITRQGVRDSVKRGEQTLRELEENFHLAERSEQYSELIADIERLAKSVREDCLAQGNMKQTVRELDAILRLAEENRELF